MTPLEAKSDLKILGLANEIGKFALEVGFTPSPPIQQAFETGIDEQWFTLVDVSPLSFAPSHLCRVFKLTPKGEERKRECLRAIATEGNTDV
jgi:hypothetical protein